MSYLKATRHAADPFGPSLGPFGALLGTTLGHGPKMEPRWHQKGPRWPKDGPKVGPRGPTMAQDGPEMAPRWSQQAPRWPQDGPKVALGGPIAQTEKHQKTIGFSMFLGSVGHWADILMRLGSRLESMMGI